jgi:hypothetical protein
MLFPSLSLLFEFGMASLVARRLLKSLSIKQGIKYDDPESAKDIPAFIQFHNLDIEEVSDPLDAFSTCFFKSFVDISHE